MLMRPGPGKVVVWVSVATVNCMLKLTCAGGPPVAQAGVARPALRPAWVRRCGLRRFMSSLGVIGLVAGLHGCAAPQPVAPEKLMAQRAEPRPDWLKELNVSEAKAKRIVTITHRVRRAFLPYDLARVILLKEVLTQIRQGELKRQQLLPAAEQMLREFDRGLPVLLVGLNELHAVLDQAERERLVELFAGARDKTPEEREQERQERIQRILDLSTGQRTELFPALLALALRHWGLLREVERGVNEAKQRFLSEEFDARTLTLVLSRRPMEILEAVYEALEITLPVLTAAQRQTLAAYLESRLR